MAQFDEKNFDVFVTDRVLLEVQRTKAQTFAQQFGEDYDGPFVPMINYEALRREAAMAATRERLSWEAKHRNSAVGICVVGLTLLALMSACGITIGWIVAHAWAAIVRW